MECEVISPDRDDQRDAGICVRGEHALVGNPHGMDEIRFHAVDVLAQALRGAANRQRTEPVSDGSPQAHGPRGSGARALGRFLNRAKRYRHQFKALNGEIQFTLKCGSDMDFVASICKVTDPIGGDGGAGIDDVKDFHGAGIIRHCPTG